MPKWAHQYTSSTPVGRFRRVLFPGDTYESLFLRCVVPAAQLTQCLKVGLAIVHHVQGDRHGLAVAAIQKSLCGRAAGGAGPGVTHQIHQCFDGLFGVLAGQLTDIADLRGPATGIAAYAG